jgi:hypothetical protein
MKTYPILKDDGTMRGFEITSAWVTFRPLYKILRSIDGVTDVHRQHFNEDHIIFNYYGEPFLVNEPFGDNSRYWVGPKDPDTSQHDMTPIQNAFQRYNGPMVCILSRIINAIKGQQNNPPDPRSAGR